MSTTMDQIHHIREMYYQQDKSITQIASETGLNRKTVSKYVDMEDFSSPPPLPMASEEHISKLDPFKALIDSWLQADKLAPRKQRHTAKRIHRRLKNEAAGFECSYRLVALYVKEKKAELRLNKNTGYLPLEHRPGEAQADFGTADFYENGKLHHQAKYFVLSFPYSNGGFLQLNYGENMESIPWRWSGRCPSASPPAILLSAVFGEIDEFDSTGLLTCELLFSGPSISGS